MEDYLMQEYLKLLQRLTVGNNDDINEDEPDDMKKYFNTETADGIPIRKLFVANLAERTTYKDLNKVFSKYGNIECCYLKRNSNKSNYAFITFSDPQDALKARIDGFKKEIRLHNRDLRVCSADSWHQPYSIECQNKLAQLNKASQANDEFVSLINQEEDESLINKLNDDCLLQIFECLPVRDRVKVERVCKRWRIVSLNSWNNCRKLEIKNLSSNQITTVTTSSLRKVLLRCGQFLNSISTEDVIFDVSGSTITIITKLCPNIQRIDIRNIKDITPSGILSLTKAYSNLVELRLGSCTYRPDTDLQKLFKNNLNLKLLEMNATQIDGTCLLYLGDLIENLILIQLHDINWMYFVTALSKLRNLKTLTIKDCIHPNNSCLEAISKLPKLKQLVFSGQFPMVTIEGGKHFANMKNIKEINLKNCEYLVDNNLVISLKENCLNLTSLNISNCRKVKDTAVSQIFYLPNLEHLEIAFLRLYSFNIYKKCLPLKLKTINLEANCDLNDKSICEILQGSPNLEVMILNFCYSITTKVLEVATKSTKYRTNNILLKLEAHNTVIESTSVTEISPLLHIVNPVYRRGKSENFTYKLNDNYTYFTYETSVQ